MTAGLKPRYSCKGPRTPGRRVQGRSRCVAGSVAHQGEGLDGGQEGADEGGGSLLHSQALLALAAVGLPPRAQPLLLQRLHTAAHVMRQRGIITGHTCVDIDDNPTIRQSKQ